MIFQRKTFFVTNKFISSQTNNVGYHEDNLQFMRRLGREAIYTPVRHKKIR